MFWIAFFVLVITNVIYCFMGSAEVQDWNEPLTSKENQEPDTANGSTPSGELKNYKTTL